MDIQVEYIDINIDDIKNICRQCLERALDDVVYSRPESEDYIRTYALKNCIEVNEQFGEISIKINPPSHTYVSWSPNWENKEVSPYVPDWVDMGHGGIVHNEATDYINLAIQYIKEEFNAIGLDNFDIDRIENELPYL